jgi:hypothetical protein
MVMSKGPTVAYLQEAEIPSRRSALAQGFAVFLAATAMPLKNANAGTDFVPVTEDIEGSDGTISKVGFTYPKNWKYERDVSHSIFALQLNGFMMRIKSY